MSRRKKNNEATFSPYLALTVKGKMVSLLRDELGLGSQPRVIRLLVDDLFEEVDRCYQSVDAVRPGQVLVLVPEAGTKHVFKQSLKQTPTVPVRLTLVCEDDIRRLAAGHLPAEVRIKKLCRMVREAHEQGGTLTIAHLALLTGLVPATVSRDLRRHHQATGEVLPLRGTIEDIGPGITHKVQIITLYLQGKTITEIARLTNHAPTSVERYITRFNQIRELARYLDPMTPATVIGRIVRCGPHLAQAYLDLIPEEEKINKR